MSYENILVETRGKVGIVTLNRPKALNALSPELTRELAHALDAFEADDNIGCMIVTGSNKAFAAGADIKAMKDKTYMDLYKSDFITADWERVAACRKPVRQSVVASTSAPPIATGGASRSVCIIAFMRAWPPAPSKRAECCRLA